MKVDRPQAVVRFLQADLFVGECVGELQQSVPKFERPAGGDTLHEGVSW
jgi:hypothetical protein